MFGNMISKLENKYDEFYIYGREYPTPVILLALAKNLIPYCVTRSKTFFFFMVNKTGGGQ